MHQLLWIFIICLSLVHTAHAETPQKASLAACLAWGLERSPSLEEGEARVRKAKALLAEVDAVNRPQLQIMGMIAPTATALGQPGNAGIYSTAKIHSITDWETGTASLIQPLFTFGKIEHYQEAAKHGIDVAKAQRDAQLMDHALLITKAYQGYLLAHSAAAIAKQVDGILLKAIAQTMEMLDNEDDEADPMDLMKLRNGRGFVLKTKIEAEHGLSFAQSALRTLTYHNVIPKERRLQLIKLPQHSLHEWVHIAHQSRPEFQLAKAGIAATAELLAEKHAEAYPDIFMIAAFTAAHSSGRSRIIDPFIQDQFNHAYGTVGLGIRWKFDFGITDSRIEQAKAAHEEVLAKGRFADEMIPLEIERDYTDLDSLKQQALALRKSARAGKRWLITSASQYELGIGEAKEIFSALAGYASSEGAYLTAVYQHNLKAMQLLRHVGQLTSHDLKGR